MRSEREILLHIGVELLRAFLWPISALADNFHGFGEGIAALLEGSTLIAVVFRVMIDSVVQRFDFLFDPFAVR